MSNLSRIVTVIIVLLIASIFAMVATAYTVKMEDHEYTVFIVGVAFTVTATAIILAIVSGLYRSD